MDAVKRNRASPLQHYSDHNQELCQQTLTTTHELKEAQQSSTPIEKRNIESVSSDVFECEAHKKIVCTLIAEQIPTFIVDDDSLVNMAEALKFAGIDTIECAEKMNLQIIPPGPVFHTWYAYKGITLFDGVNNEKGFNYVAQLNEQAKRLAEWDIPMIVIYTTNSMTKDQIIKMDSIFDNHSNIIVLNIERDLSDLPLSQRFLIQKKGEEMYLDGIRSEVLMDFQRVLSKAKIQANNKGKKGASQRLDKWQNKSITYMDMDNYFLRRPFFQIAPNGFLKTYNFSHHFKLKNIEVYANKIGITLPSDLIEDVRKQSDLLEFTHVHGKNPSVADINRKAEKLYTFVRSGEAERVWHRASRYLNLKFMNQSWTELFVPWTRDCNFLMAKSGFEARIPPDSLRYGPASRSEQNPIYEAVLEDQTMPAEEFKEKAIRLGGLQQIKSIYIGSHKSFL